MGTTTRDNAARPLGVIACLAAGFEVLGRHLWLIALPVLLDLFLWMGPRLSVAPLIQGFLAILRSQPAYNLEMAQQVVEGTRLLEEFAEQFNLFSLLSAVPLFDLPSLLAHGAATASPLGEPFVLPVANVLMLLVWCAVLLPVGLALGFLYLNGVARGVGALRPASKEESTAGELAPSSSAELEPGGEAETAEPVQTLPVSRGIGKFTRVFAFSAGLLVIGLGVLLLLALLTQLTAALALWLGGVVAPAQEPDGVLLIAQLLPGIVWIVGIGLTSYVVLHLLFVVHGVLLGGRGLLRAVFESVVMVHVHLPFVIFLLVLVFVAYEGLGYVWSLPPGESWLFLVGILGNGCVATGLTAATFVFYQERVRLLPAVRRVVKGNGSRNGKEEGAS